MKRILALPCMLVLLAYTVLLLGAAPASARVLRSPLGSFGPGGVGVGAFVNPQGVAVDAKGNVYVYDATGTGEGSVYRFNAAGEKLEFTSTKSNVLEHVGTAGFRAGDELAISTAGATAGDLYVANDATVAVYSSESGSKLGELNSEVTLLGHPWANPCGVAVDPAGHVYVGLESGKVNRYTPVGAVVKNENYTSTLWSLIGETCQITVDPSENVYVNTWEQGPVTRYGVPEFNTTETPPAASTRIDESGSTLAVDAATGRLFIDEQSDVAEYEGAAPFTRLLEITGLTKSFGVAAFGTGPAERLYVPTKAPTPVVNIYGPAFVLPDVVTGEASAGSASSATFRGTVNPDGVQITACSFEYGPTESYGSSVACEANPGSGTEPKEVSASVKGLQAGLYHYRLVAANKNGQSEGQDRTLQAGALIEGESPANVTSTGAELQATINPGGQATAYRVEYGASAGYGSSTPEASIAANSGPVTTTVPLTGLQPHMSYHFRFVATNAFGVTIGADTTLTTQTAGGELTLPDGRKWEMVSPPDKHGALLEPIAESGVIQAAADGDAITYLAGSPTESTPQGNSNRIQVLSTHTPGGWVSRDIAPPQVAPPGAAVGRSEEYSFFSSDLSLAVLQPLGPFVPALSPEASEQTVFLRTNFVNGSRSEPCDPPVMHCYRPLLTGKEPFADVPPGTVFGEQALFVGASPDSTHVLVFSDVALAPGGGEGGLYEWAAGRLQLVGVKTDNLAKYAHHAISDDGSRVVFTGESEGLKGLLMRDVAVGKTVKLDAVQGGSGSEPEAPHFQAASSDGSRVFFTDTQRLTSDAGAEGAPRPDEGAKPDLYECVIVVQSGAPTCELRDLTPPSEGEPAGVQEDGATQGGVLGVSEDGSWVYFVADGVQGHAPGAVRGTCGGSSEAGLCNLYALHFNGSEWEDAKLVTILAKEDNTDWEGELRHSTARVSPDGDWLAFMSQRRLATSTNAAGYDNRDATSGKPDQEVYLYHASTGTLVCTSCNPTGARPHGVEVEQLGAVSLVGGDGVFGPHTWLAANVPGWTPYVLKLALYQSRYLSDNGRLFFNSSDALVPQDVNGTEDVYQYEPPGVGGCSPASAAYSALSAGCVDLISAGESPEESAFLDASATGGRDAEGHEGGGDVFFLTASKLVPQDQDSALDVYDAHECTSSAPCLSSIVPPPPCTTADACRAAGALQPEVFGAPASATFFGPGNVPAPSTPVAKETLTRLRARQLARALKACHAKHNRRKRAVCEAQARKRYDPAKKAKKSNGSRRAKRTRGRR